MPYWQGYTKDMTEDQMRAAFRKAWGYEPDVILGSGPVWFCGPLHHLSKLDNQRAEQAAAEIEQPAEGQLRLI